MDETTKTTILAKLAELENEKVKLLEDANRILNRIEGAVSVLQDLLKEEEPVESP